MKSNNKLGLLIIHGFAGGTFQVQALADYLNKNGYITSCPKLKGHTGNSKDMKTADYKDWITSAEEELIQLMKKTDEIAIIGFSMGGLIAINLASKYDVKALVTINTPIYFWNLKRVLLNIYDDIRKRRLNYIKRYIRAKKSSPMISMINFLKLLNNTKPKLSNVKSPLLIIQTKDDDTTKLKSANSIYDHIKSRDKEIKLYDKGGHLVLLSPYKNDIIMGIDEFIGQV